MLWLVASGATILLLGWWTFASTTYRYKLTVEVETPEGLRSGSAVREVSWAKGVNITPEATTASMTHRGEAVMVDLPHGQALFALMSPDGQETPALAFGSARQSRWSDRSIKVLEPLLEAEAVYGQSGYPRLVRFRDINDPKTVEKVDPIHLSAAFGPGYRLKRITAQIVDDRLSDRISTVLNWLGQYPEPRLEKIPPGGTINPNFAQRLTHGDFTQGMQK